jgi:hypothetical protein
MYCDQLSHPITQEYTLLPSEKRFEFDLAFLKTNPQKFLKNIDDKIMDGYLIRYHQQVLDKQKNAQHELLPV